MKEIVDYEYTKWKAMVKGEELYFGGQWEAGGVREIVSLLGCS
jgi:hypothetical protein